MLVYLISGNLYLNSTAAIRFFFDTNIVAIKDFMKRSRPSFFSKQTTRSGKKKTQNIILPQIYTQGYLSTNTTTISPSYSWSIQTETPFVRADTPEGIQKKETLTIKELYRYIS